MSTPSRSAHETSTRAGLAYGLAAFCFWGLVPIYFKAVSSVPALEVLAVDELVLEFANREFAELDLLAGLADRFDLAVGVIDVKNFFVETPDLVAERIARVLAYVPAHKLIVTADCGFSALPRYIAFQKLCAMTEGAALARAAL